MTTTTETKVVCVWLDETSDPEWSAWVVSRDTIDDRGRTLTTDTVRFFQLDQHDDAYSLATAAAVELGAKLGLPVMECDRHGVHQAIA